MSAKGFTDCNKFTLDQHCEILENEFRFSSSGIAKSVFELIEFYKKHKPSVGKKKPYTESKCNKHIVSNSVCNHDSQTYIKINGTVYRLCLKCKKLIKAN